MKNIVSRLSPWILMAALTPTLVGCFGVAVVGAGTGALMATDRRMSETYLADEGIEIRSANRIGEKYGDKVHVNVTSYNRTLLLTGEVPDAETKDAVEKIATSVSEVRRITNELQISGITSFAARSNDTYLTSKVKARFLDAARFSINHVKVISENGAVYLLGLVTQKEADAAVEIARTTGGVQRVIRVFEVITDEQARQLDNRKADNDTKAAAKK
ncbi:MAG TPA: BON domain-containing protein [Rhodocyclaceae bacterium]|jgi:osmotically-inducible protein OsmY|nr:BON domain-containing protein [Rhodocyclaceae bacterium]